MSSVRVVRASSPISTPISTSNAALTRSERSRSRPLPSWLKRTARPLTSSASERGTMVAEPARRHGPLSTTYSMRQSSVPERASCSGTTSAESRRRIGSSTMTRARTRCCSTTRVTGAPARGRSGSSGLAMESGHHTERHGRPSSRRAARPHPRVPVRHGWRADRHRPPARRGLEADVRRVPGRPRGPGAVRHRRRLRPLRRRTTSLRRGRRVPALARDRAGRRGDPPPGRPQERPRAEAHPRPRRRPLSGLGALPARRARRGAAHGGRLVERQHARGAARRRDRGALRRARGRRDDRRAPPPRQACARLVPRRRARPGRGRGRGHGLRGRPGRRRGGSRGPVRPRSRRRPRGAGGRVARARRRRRRLRPRGPPAVIPGHPGYPAEPWCVRETALDLGFLAQSESIFALSNGHLGLRGNLDEGEPRGLSGTYLAGFFESYKLDYGERGFGWPEDGQAVVPVTDGKLIRLLVEDEPFDVHRGTLHEHERNLDLRAGMLTRRARWSSEYGRAVQVTSRRLVSFRERSVAAISYEVEALDRPLRVALQSNLAANRGERSGAGDPRAGRDLGDVLTSRLAVDHGLRVVLGHATRRSGLALAAGMEHVVDADGEVTTLTESEPDLGRVTISVKLEPGRPLRVVKLLAYHWSSQQSLDWLRDQVDASLENALAEGFDGLAAEQREFLDDYWERADIELDGDPEIQQALRFALFHVLQASARTETRGIAAKGLTGPGYDGHAFWDTEAFVLPVLTYSEPQAVRQALQWRHSTLEPARDRARQLGLAGAAFPWRTIHGEECSAYWPAGTAAFHVNAAVAQAAARYVAATGDTEFERVCGVDLLVETARLWISLGHHGLEGDFRIDGVTGPDEYSALVDNNVYTNLMAQANLREAARAVERHPDAADRLGVSPEEAGEWRAAAAAMYVPFDERLGVHPQDQDFTEHDRWDFARTPPDHYPLLLHYPYLQL